MAVRKSLLCSAAVLLYLAIVNFHPAEASCGGFTRTCSGITIGSDGVLKAFCMTNKLNSYTSKTSLNLDKYVGNINGALSANSGGFRGSCSDVGVNRNTHDYNIMYLKADCKMADRVNYMYSFIELNNNVVNINGQMKWIWC